jgi:Gpi18-like mannosyltransferase
MIAPRLETAAATITAPTAGTHPPRWRFAVTLAALLLGAALLRISLGWQMGHEGDMVQWVEWADAGASQGLGVIYQRTLANYPPAYVSILWVLGKARTVWPALKRPDYGHLLLKSPALISDLLIALVIAVLVAQRFGEYYGSWAAALYLFNPAVISDSTVWGQTDAVVPLCPLLALYLIGRGRSYLAGALLGIAMAIKFQSIVFVLGILAFALVDLGVVQALAMAIAGTVAFLGVALPFILAGEFGHMLSKAYLENFNAYPVTELGALNFWQVVGAFAYSDDNPLAHIAGLTITPKLIGLSLFAFAATVIVLIGCAARTLTGRAYALGMAAWAFFMFPTEIHERYLLPAVAFFAICAPRGLVAASVFAVVSAIHIHSCHARNLLGPVILTLLLPGFLAAFFHVRAECAADPDGPHRFAPDRLSRLVVGCGRWLMSHMWLPTLILAVAVAVGALAVRGWFQSFADELSLAHLGSWRGAPLSYNGDARGGPLRVGQKAFATGFQVNAGTPIGFRFPPLFGMFRAGIGFQASASPACTAVYAIRDADKPLYRSEPVGSADAVRWIGVPLGHYDTDLTLTVEVMGCDSEHRFDWINPRLVAWPYLIREGDPAEIYISDLPEQSVLPVPAFGVQGSWRRDVALNGSKSLSIGGEAYSKGLAVHGDSVLKFRVPDGFSAFVTDLGYDDEIPAGNNKLQFAIWVDGAEAYRSPAMTPQQRIAGVHVPVHGGAALVLIVDSLGFTDGDHADWGAARFVRGG